MKLPFTDLPIQRKFLYFAFGIQFWFLFLFAVTVASLLFVDRTAGDVVDKVIPQDRLSQRAVRNLHAINSDAADIFRAESTTVISHKAELAHQRLSDTYKLLDVLIKGGEYHDISRDTGQSVETMVSQPVTGWSAGELFVKEVRGNVIEIEQNLSKLAEARSAFLRGEHARAAAVRDTYQALQVSIARALAVSSEFSAKAASLYSHNSSLIRTTIAYGTVAVTVVLVIASIMLFVISRWIARSFTGPVQSITEQIRELGEGKVDSELIGKLNINGKDEIGILFAAFNGLMESIKAMSSYKKVIEEDDSVEDIYARLGKVFAEVIGFEEYRIFEVIENQNSMTLTYPFAMGGSDMYCNPEILDACNLCRAKKTGRAISSMNFPRICKQFISDVGREHVCVPMIVGGSTCGIVQFVVDRPATAHEIQLLDRKIFKAQEYITESLSVIEAKRLMSTLRDSSLKDPLTGLNNRRFLQEHTDAIVSGVLRRGKNVGLIMCDLDYFKQVNDTYGHNVGDAVLAQTSQIIKRSVRESDLVVRFGGEEFLVVLLDVAPDETEQVAEKIRLNMENAQIKVPDGTLKKTISLGIAEFPVDAENFNKAIKFADVALYKAKDQGRNRCVRYTPDMWSGEQY